MTSIPTTAATADQAVRNVIAAAAAGDIAAYRANMTAAIRGHLERIEAGLRAIHPPDMSDPIEFSRTTSPGGRIEVLDSIEHDDGLLEVRVRMAAAGGDGSDLVEQTSLFAVREGGSWKIVPAELRGLSAEQLTALADETVARAAEQIRQALGHGAVPPRSPNAADFRPDFLAKLDALRADADRLAAAHPTEWQYQTIAQVCQGFEMMTADGRVPQAHERAVGDGIVQAFQYGEPPGPELADLIRRFVELNSLFKQWPDETPEDRAAAEAPAEPDEADGGFAIAGFEEFVVLLHRTRDGIDRIRGKAVERIHSGDRNARIIIDSLDPVRHALDQMHRAVADWTQDGAPPEGGRCKDARISGRDVAKLRKAPAGELRELAGAVGRLDRYFRTSPPWNGGTQDGAELGGVIVTLYRTLADARALADAAPDHPGVRQVVGGLEQMARDIHNWADDFDPPTDEDREAIHLSAVAAAEFGLADYIAPGAPGNRQYGDFIDRARQVAAAVAEWPLESLPRFYDTLFETSLDSKLLIALTGSRGLSDLDYYLDQIIYRTAGGRAYADHERRENRLGEYIDRELAIFGHASFGGFLPRLAALESFYQAWRPPGREELDDSDDSDDSDDADDSAADGEVDSGESDEVSEEYERATSEAAGLDPSYFRHLLESTNRHFAAGPLKSPLCRRIGMQLRAVRRWLAAGGLDDGQRPATEAVLRAACADAEQNCGNANEMRYARSVLAYALRPDAAQAAAAASSDKTPAPKGMIGSPEEYSRLLAETIADAECLLALAPREPAAADLVCRLRRMQQAADFGRVLSPMARDEAAQGISAAIGDASADGAPLFPDVPDFADDFNQRLRLLLNYFTGRRVDSAGAFFELLDAVLAQAGQMLRSGAVSLSNGRSIMVGDHDTAILARIERQLRAVKRWLAGGRCPSDEEKGTTEDVLDKVHTLQRSEELAEFARRVRELDAAFADWPEGPEVELPSYGPITSREEFDRILAETMRDVAQLRARPLAAKPTDMQAFFDGIDKQLGKMEKFLDAGRRRSEREREEIHTVLEGVPAQGENPCPTIHDFRADFVGRLHRLNAFFRGLMSAPPYAQSEVRAIGTAFLRSVVLGSPARMAFVRLEGADPGLYACRWEMVQRTAPDGPFDVRLSEYLPTSLDLVRLVPFDGREPTDLRWSPRCARVAYRIVNADGSAGIGWCDGYEPGELGRVPGDAFTWAVRNESLVIADSTHKVVTRLNVETRQTLDLCAFHDDGDPVFPPQLLVAPDGGSLVFTCRRAKDAVSEMWIIEFRGASPVARMLRRFPRAAVRVLPFWCAGALGYLAVDSDRGTSEISLTGTADGAKPEMLWRSDVAEPLRTPSASPTGRWIAFYRSAGSGGPGGLSVLDCDSREVLPLPLPAGVVGTPKFGDGGILIQGESSAHLAWMPGLDQRRAVVERF